MSMYTRIDIENPERTGGYIIDEWFASVEFFDPYSHHGENDAAIEENSKYENDAVHPYAIEYTKAYPEAEVTIREEWTGEDRPTIDEVTYRGGEKVDAKRSEIVPADLPQLIADVRAALDARGHLAYDAAPKMFEAARALVDALDPEGATK